MPKILPLENNSKDIIYNVESSHCYGNVEAFVKEVYRSLKAGGNFCWTDFRDKDTMEKLHNKTFWTQDLRLYQKGNYQRSLRCFR